MSRNRSQNQSRFQFKSSGQTPKEEIDYASSISFTRLIGIKTPLELGNARSGLFKMHTSLKSQIADNLRNLIQTNHGERLGRYNFGANLVELAFENTELDVKQEVAKRVSRAVNTFMPFIQVDDYDVFVERKENQHTAKVGIELTYSIPRLRVENQKIEVILGVAG